MPLCPLHINAAIGSAAVLLSPKAVPALCRHNRERPQAAPSGNGLFKTCILLPLDGLVLTWISSLCVSLLTAQMLFAVVERSVSS